MAVPRSHLVYDMCQKLLGEEPVFVRFGRTATPNVETVLDDTVSGGRAGPSRRVRIGKALPRMGQTRDECPINETCVLKDGRARQTAAMRRRSPLERFAICCTSDAAVARETIVAMERRCRLLMTSRPRGRRGPQSVVIFGIDPPGVEGRAGELQGGHLTSPLKFELAMDLGTGPGRQLKRKVLMPVLRELERTDDPSNNMVLAHRLQTTVINGMLKYQRSWTQM